MIHQGHLWAQSPGVVLITLSPIWLTFTIIKSTVRTLKAQNQYILELPSLLQQGLLVAFIAVHLSMADGENATDWV
jgi:hypothetical protein